MHSFAYIGANRFAASGNTSRWNSCSRSGFTFWYRPLSIVLVEDSCVNVCVANCFKWSYASN